MPKAKRWTGISGALSKEEVIKKLKELKFIPLSEETLHGME